MIACLAQHFLESRRVPSNERKSTFRERAKREPCHGCPAASFRPVSCHSAQDRTGGARGVYWSRPEEPSQAFRVAGNNARRPQAALRRRSACSSSRLATRKARWGICEDRDVTALRRSARGACRHQDLGWVFAIDPPNWMRTITVVQLHSVDGGSAKRVGGPTRFGLRCM